MMNDIAFLAALSQLTLATVALSGIGIATIIAINLIIVIRDRLRQDDVTNPILCDWPDCEQECGTPCSCYATGRSI